MWNVCSLLKNTIFYSYNCCYVTHILKAALHQCCFNNMHIQGRTDHLETQALPEGPGGPHEMPLVPFS
ncbi:unnamed protein product [Staurois parvus]|uniref:Uncharacterized protein n=1 Tax=Staurois parvus TaxID=386267 RepID=A0ABN9FRH3_9NEOB|nr:unnamed protein product [Staurois parvus]